MSGGGATIVATHIGVPVCGSTSIRCPHCGRHLLEAEEIKNTQIVEELSLPPVKIHCSVLAEDAIKAAVADYRQKQAKLQELKVAE